MKLISEPEPKPIYQIKVQGRLDERWSDWLDGLIITYECESEEAAITTLTGRIVDQSALRGILNRLWDLNLTLLFVTRIAESSDNERGRK